MSKKKLILIPSEKMDKNKKQDRNEHGLVRMSKTARSYMDFDTEVEVYPNSGTTEDRLRGAILLNIFQAYSEDIKKLKEENYSEKEIERIGFVTTRTFNRITGKGKNKENIWITDKIENIVLGADPEFILFDGDEIIRANNHLGYNGSIGSDGAMAEIRPNPAISPEEIVHNIRQLFCNKELTKSINKFDWFAGCYFKDNRRDYPIGGHIHIGNPVQVAKLSIDKRVNFFKAFNKILDELIAIPMIKIDGEEAGCARRTKCTMGKYGYFGEFRTCNGRLEHRTLSGMWLMHPTLTVNVFGTIKAIVNEVFNLIAENKFDSEYMFPDKYKNTDVWNKDFKGWKNIGIVKDLNCKAPSKYMIEMLNNSSSRNINKKFLDSWYNRMRRLSTYKLYSTYIDALYEILNIPYKEFDSYDKNIKKNWIDGKKFII